MKYRNHPSVIIIPRFFSGRNSSFYFSPIDKNTILKEIKGLSTNKAVQERHRYTRQSFKRKYKLFC